MFISVFCFKIFFRGGFWKLFAPKRPFEKIWQRLTVRGGGRKLIFEWPLFAMPYVTIQFTKIYHNYTKYNPLTCLSVFFFCSPISPNPFCILILLSLIFFSLLFLNKSLLQFMKRIYVVNVLSFVFSSFSNSSL